MSLKKSKNILLKLVLPVNLDLTWILVYFFFQPALYVKYIPDFFFIIGNFGLGPTKIKPDNLLLIILIIRMFTDILFWSFC